MKKFLLVFILIIFITNNIFSQTVYKNYWDGSAYFKIKSDIEIPVYKSNVNNLKDFDKFPEIKQIIKKYKVIKIEKPFKTIALQNIYRISFNSISDIEYLIRDLQNIDFVKYAVKNQIYRLSSVPDDVNSNQWYFDLIQAYNAWDITTGRQYIKVAIVDDACKISHPDLTQNIYTNIQEIPDDSIDNDNNGYIDDVHGYDVADNDNDPEPPLSHPWYSWMNDAFSHGTHCSGIASAVTNNGTGIASIGYGVSIIPVKCTKDTTSLPLAMDETATGIDYAIAAKADIISMSWVSGTKDSVVTDAINAAHQAGIILVAAAGNNGDTTWGYPASNDYVISVGATTYNDTIADFSERNSMIDVMAPGDDIWSTVRKDNGYSYMQGTSMSCPMVAGLCGLMLSIDSSLTPEVIENCLKSSCDNIDSVNPSATGMMGAGRINAYNALICIEDIVNINKYNVNNKLIIYPNPADKQLIIKSLNKKYNNIEIYNSLGKLILHKNIDLTTKNPFIIDIDNFSNGIYIIKASEGNNIAIGKFVVNK